MNILGKLAEQIKKSESEITGFLATAPLKYKVYTIPKRTSGHRVIAQPTSKLKDYQRAFIELQKFPIHKAATAYRESLSIKDNANRHKRNQYLLKMDLENFFNSITNQLLWTVWDKHFSRLSIEDRNLIEKLLFWSPSKTVKGKLVLSVGAPSSPTISNFVMYQFDKEVDDLCVKNRITYTRYADDLTFSTNKAGTLFEVPRIVSDKLKELFGDKLNVNRRKTVFSSKAHNRHVTGITLTNEGLLSIGRKRKRYLKHLIHKFQEKEASEDEISYLRGMLAFVKNIEPDFLSRMEEKYSKALMNQIAGKRDG